MDDQDERPPSSASFDSETPGLAAHDRARFARQRHHVLGTLRPDGAPQLSGTRVRIDDQAVVLGTMPRSAKLADVRRDPRIEGGELVVTPWWPGRGIREVGRR